MPAILLFSAGEDRDRAIRIVDALIESGLDVQYVEIDLDQAIPATARDLIDEARCAIFCWSHGSTDERAGPYRNLAAQARLSGIAIGVEFDRGSSPQSMAGVTVYDLSGGRLGRSPWGWISGSLFIKDIVAAARYKIAGRDPPPPSAPRKLLLRRLWLGFVSVASAAALLSAIPQLHQSIPWPRFYERSAWAAVKPNSCADLLAFRKAYPGGIYAGEALARYDARKFVKRTVWVRASRPAPLLVWASDAQPLPSEAAARATVASQAAEEARASCGAFTRIYGAKVLAARIGAGTIECSRVAAGHVCGIPRGEAICELEEPVEATEEICER